MSAQPAAAPPARSYVIEGRTVTMPVVVRDATSAAATYLVDAAAARRLLPGPELDVVELLPGRALFSIACIQYRDNDLGDYNEVSLAFFVRRRDQPRGAPWIVVQRHSSTGDRVSRVCRFRPNVRVYWRRPQCVREPSTRSAK